MKIGLIIKTSFFLFLFCFVNSSCMAQRGSTGALTNTFPNSGNVGIGTTEPKHPLEVGNGAHCDRGGSWNNASSREYKENIRELSSEQALAALTELRPVVFNYKVDKSDDFLGFIAEDVPDLIATRDRKSLSPMDIVAVLTRVVQLQQNKIEALENRLKNMK